VHAASAGGLDAWAAGQGALELHEGTADLVTHARLALLVVDGSMVVVVGSGGGGGGSHGRTAATAEHASTRARGRGVVSTAGPGGVGGPGSTRSASSAGATSAKHFDLLLGVVECDVVNLGRMGCNDGLLQLEKQWQCEVLLEGCC
jgi:hypothetical protein